MHTTPKNSILLVEDSRLNLVIMEELLGDEFELSIVMNGEEALEVAPDILPDLILLDIILPGIDGFKVLQQLRSDQKTADIPVIFLTGRDDEEDRIKGRDLGCFAFIQKPFQPEDVLQSIHDGLQLCGMKE
jgi:CheY-like chemotaxis protein